MKVVGVFVTVFSCAASLSGITKKDFVLAKQHTCGYLLPTTQDSNDRLECLQLLINSILVQPKKLCAAIPSS
jgi:hypothetical protein